MRYFLSECKCGKKQITHIRPISVECGSCHRIMKEAIEVDKKLRPIGSSQPETDRNSRQVSMKVEKRKSTVSSRPETSISIQGELDLM